MRKEEMNHTRIIPKAVTVLGLVLGALIFTTATLEFVEAQGSISVTKTADPSEVEEPGGPVDFTVRVDNTSATDSVTITALTDDLYGDLTALSGSTCSVPQVLASGEHYECSFSATVSGNVGDSETDTVTALGTDDDGNGVSGGDDATVTITDVPSSISVTKDADPGEVEERGGQVDFTVRVDNTSATDNVTITALTHHLYG
jgi:hypothetical protein